MKKILNYYLPNILFNFFEIIVIFLIGIVLDVSIEYILIIFISFILNKVIFGKSLHYKDWYLCLIWSTLLFISFYLLSKVDIKIAIFFTSTYVFFSNKANIKDLNNLFFWKRNELNERVLEWVRFNLDNKDIIKYKQQLKETDKRKYYIFVYYFEEHNSFERIAEIMEIDRQRIGEEVAIMSHYIEYGIRLK